MFKEISAKEIDCNLIKAISEEWMLISAGDSQKYNMMTASWGFAGEMWGNDAMMAVIRPQRYTMEFINNNDSFALCFMGDNKEIHKICGSKSGKDINKMELDGITPVFADNTVYFNEARMVVICKKQYVQQMNEACFVDSEPLRWYDNDLHYMVIGKIEKVLIKE